MVGAVLRVVRGREGGAAAARQEERDDRAVVDGLVAVPGEGIEARVPVGRDRSVAAEGAAVDDRAAHGAVRAARADALELHALGDDQVLVVRAARVLARVGARLVRVDDHERAGRGRVERVLDRMVGGRRKGLGRGEPAAGGDLRRRVVRVVRRADLVDLRVVGPTDPVEGQAVDRGLAVGGGDHQLVRTLADRRRDHRCDRDLRCRSRWRWSIGVPSRVSWPLPFVAPKPRPVT